MIVKELWDQIEALAVTRPGDVRETLRRWMMKKTYAGVLPETRRSIPRAWVNDAWYKQKGKCPICRGELKLEEAEGDHWKSLAIGGKHARSNVRAVHGVKSEEGSRCNQMKGSRSPHQEAKRLGRTVMEQIEDSHMPPEEPK